MGTTPMGTRWTSRERILAALRCQPVDYVPCSGSFNPPSEVQRRGHTWSFPWPASASPEEQLRYQVEVLGLDQIVHVGLAATRPAPGVTAAVRLEHDVLHKTYHTPAGDLHAAVRYNDLCPMARTSRSTATSTSAISSSPGSRPRPTWSASSRCRCCARLTNS